MAFKPRRFYLFVVGDIGQLHHRSVRFVHERRLSGRRPAHHRIGPASGVRRLVRHVLGAGPLLQRDQLHHAAGPVVHAVQSGHHGVQLRLSVGLQDAQPEPRDRPVRREKDVCQWVIATDYFTYLLQNLAKFPNSFGFISKIYFLKSQK